MARQVQAARSSENAQLFVCVFSPMNAQDLETVDLVDVSSSADSLQGI